MKIKDRAIANEKKCQVGAGQILYTLAAEGILAEPFRSYAAGMEVPESDKEKWDKVINEVAGDILMFNDEITENGSIL